MIEKIDGIAKLKNREILWGTLQIFKFWYPN
jgi:hypothetical protein